MDKIKTGELIKAARTSKNLTQSELGDMLGVTNKAVSRWEKGESFPDVGVLESLASALELRIQDIVVGEVRPEEVPAKETEQLLTDLIFQSNLQQRQKKKTVLGLLIWALALLFAILAGYSGLYDTRLLFENHCDIAFPVMLGMTLVLILYGWHTQCLENIPTAKPEKVMCIISIISLIWAVFITFSPSVLCSRGTIPFGLALNQVGPFIVIQLAIICVLNVLMLLIEFIRWAKEKGTVHQGFVLQFTAIYLSALYGEALHRMISFEGFLKVLITLTAVTLLEMTVVLAAMKIIKKRNNKTALKN